jgi:predicted phage tail protein
MIDIAQAGRGSPNWSNDKFTVVWADTADIPVAQFGMGNIVAGSFEIGYNINRRTDELVASFNDENDFYISRQVRALVPGVTNPVNSSSLQFFGVTTEDQAQREINLRAANIKYHIRRIGFETSIEGMVPQRGDVVLLAHDLTAWAYSGRLQDISSDGLTLTLPRALHDPAAGPDYWIQIRLPDGTFMVEKIAPPLSPVTTVTLSTALPDFPDHFPEDFLFQAGPSATPGKRCRVLSLEPTQNETVKITCTDDYPEYYLQENSLTGEEPDNDERLIAKVYNPVVEVRDDGYWLCWEAENCRGAQVSASVSGGTGSIIGGNLTVPGLELKLPVYPSGTVISLTLVPDDVVNAVASVSASTTFTY